MAGVAASVATTTGAGAGEPQGGAVDLDVTEALAVVALFRVGGSRLRADVGLMA